jgi:hypothetical protein
MPLLSKTAKLIPDALFQMEELRWDLEGSIISPGQTVYGAFPLNRLDGGGLWSATFLRNWLVNEDQLRLWRAVRTIADGGIVPLIIERYERPFFPVPFDGNGEPMEIASISHSDGSFFSDGSGYYQPLVTAITGAAASLRATSIQINVLVGSTLKGGHCFSIEHVEMGHRIYEIGTITNISDTVYTVSFRPPLREDVALGERVEFDKPKCVMRLATPNAMSLTLQTGDYAHPDVSFIEWFE